MPSIKLSHSLFLRAQLLSIFFYLFSLSSFPASLLPQRPLLLDGSVLIFGGALIYQRGLCSLFFIMLPLLHLFLRHILLLFLQSSNIDIFLRYPCIHPHFSSLLLLSRNLANICRLSLSGTP